MSEMSYLFDLNLQLVADAVLMIVAIFVLFLVVGNKLFNPIRSILQKRQEKIKNELDTAASDMKKAEELKKEYEDKLKAIEKEADTILSDARKKALANENKIVAEAKEEAARIIERARVEAELEKQKVADEVKKEIEKEIEKEIDKEKEKDSLYTEQREERFTPPLLSDVLAVCEQEGLTHVDGDYFWNYYAATGWKCGDKPMFDWKAMLRLWEKRAIKEQPATAEYGGAYGQIL